MEAASTQPAQQLITEKEAAAILFVQEQTLRLWRHRRRGPSYYKLNGRVLYDMADLKSFIASRRIRILSK